MVLYRKTTELSKIYRGNTELNKIYRGNVEIYGSSDIPSGIPTSGLQAYHDAGIASSYPGSGTTWYDISGNNQDITWDQSPTYTSGNDGYFSTSGKTASGPAANSFGITNSSGYTIIALYRTNSGGFNSLFRFNQDSVNHNRGIFAHPGWSSNTVYFDQGGCCDSSQRLTWGSFSYSTDYLMGWRRESGGNRAILVGGSGEVSSTTTSPASISLNSNAVEFNKGGYTNAWDGRWSIWAVYNRGLSNSEFTDFYNAVKTRYGI